MCVWRKNEHSLAALRDTAATRSEPVSGDDAEPDVARDDRTTGIMYRSLRACAVWRHSALHDAGPAVGGQLDGIAGARA